MKIREQKRLYHKFLDDWASGKRRAGKIFERILDNRIREIVEITVNQHGFVKNCEIADAIHAARLLMKKHREKHRPLYIAFLDLEKGFDLLPHELIWYALRQHSARRTRTLGSIALPRSEK